jgi:FtsP/CotA-like multicopper oxidase with cupredoxin domain
MRKLSIRGKWLKPARIIAVGLFFAGALFIGLNGDVVSGQKSPPLLKNPTVLAPDPDGARRGGDVNYTLNIRYAKNTIPNPSTGRDDTVNLRSYNGELVGPTVKILPGQLLRMNLINNLPGNDPSCQSNQDMSIAHCFNSTNLHSHGWHVSPTGNSDNVLLDLGPGTSLDYEYYLPKDHPAGTFWYHSHRHGSTALQVSSGMAGVLIVEGIRPLNDITKNGIADIDTILHDTNGKRYEDRIFMFEQIEYDCGTDPNTGNLIWNCGPNDVGTIESYAGFGPGGPNSWQGSGRFTMINGLLQPLIETQAGKIERWRLIHGGVRDTINFRVVRSKVPFNTRAEMIAKLAELQKESPAQQADWMAQNCSVDAANGIMQTEFAVDGLTRKQMSPKLRNVLQPGYRSDVLMAFDQPGVYCVLDDATTPAGSINAPRKETSSVLEGVDLNDRRLLSMVFVSGGTPFKGESQEYISKQLIAANQDLPELVRKDLTQLRVPEYVPHRDVLPTEVTGKQELAFAIRTASDNTTTLFQVANLINPQPREYFSYEPTRIDRLLRLGGVDEWKLTSRFVSHPFHIHVNPFQIISILRPDGRSIIDKNGRCIDGEDPQYCDMIGVWRDTFFIKQNPANFLPTAPANPDSMGYLITMRTRYERYIGDFVLHCHILDHEDGGMMQNVRIAPIGGYLEGNPVPVEFGTKKHSH